MGKRKHYVAVDPSRFERPVRQFGTFTRLEAIAEWLIACGVRQVAMESTGVYWIPVFDGRGLTASGVTGDEAGKRSHDVLAASDPAVDGLLRGAFRAPDAPMRSYVRQRGQLIRDRSRAVQHLQKALTQMNVQLDNVLSDLMGRPANSSCALSSAANATARCWLDTGTRCRADEIATGARASVRRRR